MVALRKESTMSHATHTNKAPAWGVETKDGHSVFLLPCGCCEATTLTIEADPAVLTLRIEDIKKLEELRDRINFVIKYQKDRARYNGVGDDEEVDGLWVRRWQGHAPQSFRDMFHGWLNKWLLEETLPEGELETFRNEVLPSFSACTDTLPCEYCEGLGLPHGSTYAEAVDELLAEL
jgi:hypothetical protein